MLTAKLTVVATEQICALVRQAGLCFPLAHHFSVYSSGRWRQYRGVRLKDTTQCPLSISV